MATDANVLEEMQKQFLQLPKVVQDAINSSEIEKRLQLLATTNKLHFDQWEKLENEVMLTLLGLQAVEQLQQNIRSEVGTTDEVAKALADDISRTIFEPIRAQMEKEIAHNTAPPAPPPPPPVVPATPPPTQQQVSVVRAPVNETYKPGEASTARPTTGGDPYREPAA